MGKLSLNQAQRSLGKSSEGVENRTFALYSAPLCPVTKAMRGFSPTEGILDMTSDCAKCVSAAKETFLTSQKEKDRGIGAFLQFLINN